MPSFKSFRSLLKISRSRKESVESWIPGSSALLLAFEPYCKRSYTIKTNMIFLKILFLISERIRINNTNSIVLLIMKVIEVLFFQLLSQYGCCMSFAINLHNHLRIYFSPGEKKLNFCLPRLSMIAFDAFTVG